MPINKFYESEKTFNKTLIRKMIKRMYYIKMNFEMPKFKIQNNIGLKKVINIYIYIYIYKIVRITE